MTLSISRFSLSAFVGMLVGTLLLSACNKIPKSDGNSSPVIAEVNGERLHRNQFENYVHQESEFLDHDAEGKVRSRLLDRLIREKLIQQEATRLGLQAPARSEPEKQKLAAKVSSGATESATTATNTEVV